jgi:hypothetical protein
VVKVNSLAASDLKGTTMASTASTDRRRLPRFDRSGASPALLGLLLAVLSFAPAGQGQGKGQVQEKQLSKAALLAEARYRAARKQFDLIWQYYQQSRVESFDVYVWSRLLLDAHRSISKAPADRIMALEEHLDHMVKLETLIRKIRRLGFGRSSDVGASEYYRLEAECWLAEAKAD